MLPDLLGPLMKRLEARERVACTDRPDPRPGRNTLALHIKQRNACMCSCATPKSEYCFHTRRCLSAIATFTAVVHFPLNGSRRVKVPQPAFQRDRRKI